MVHWRATGSHYIDQKSTALTHESAYAPEWSVKHPWMTCRFTWPTAFIALQIETPLHRSDASANPTPVLSATRAQKCHDLA